MDLSKTQESILFQLKVRGSQSVKILANRLKITTMGIRQHLDELHHKGLISKTEEEKQTRGRPVHRWKLSMAGHKRFPDKHENLSIDLINLVHEKLGDEVLNRLIEAQGDRVYSRYEQILASDAEDLPKRLETIGRLRSEEGFMAEVRLLPNQGWLLIENHCPICAAAQTCQRFCESELTLFRRLLAEQATVERTDFLLEGARRCAYKVSPLMHQ